VPPAVFIDAAVAGNAEEPRPQPGLARAQRGQRHKQFEQNLLKHVPGLVVVTDLPENEPEDRHMIAAHQGLKGALVARQAVEH
jgi:hypothetical protein